MKRQNLLSIILFGLLVVSLIVLYNSMDRLDYDSYEDKHSDIIQLRFSSSWAGLDSKAVLLEEVIASFEKENPTIKIINESMYGEDFLFTLKADFASGNGPDVFGLWPGSDLKLLIDNDMIADLKPELDEDKVWSENFDPSVFEFLGQEDQIYSIPFEIIYEGLYINKDLFDTFQVAIPKNYDELLEAIKAFKKRSIIPIAYNLTPEGSFIYQNIIVQLGGKEGTENPLDANGNIHPAYIEAMYKMRELYKLGAFPNNAFTLDDASRNMLFIDKRAAMIVQGSWFNSESLDESVGLIPFPLGHDRRIVYGVGNGNFHISKQAYDNDEKRQAALKFLKYLTSEKGRTIFNTSSSFMTSAGGGNIDYLRGLGFDLIDSADQLVGPPDHYINRNFWERVLIKEFPNMLEGKIKPEEIFEKMNDY